MKLTGVLVKCLILGLFVNTCRTKIIIETAESRESSIDPLVAATVKIIKSCYPTGNGAIGFIGSGTEALVTLVSPEESLAAIFFNDITKLASNGPVPRMSRYNLKMFVVAVSSMMEFEETLVSIKSSRWWNREACFYIINQSLTETGCSAASDILWAAWKMDLLEAKFMCNYGTKGLFIYTFNPYSKDAPEPWQLETVRSGKEDHPWSLLVRRYSDNDQICENIDFDKTRKLDGYPIRSTVMNSHELHIDPAKTGMDALSGTNKEFVRDIFHAINATVKLLGHETNKSSWGNLEEEKKSFGILTDMIDGISDIGINTRYQTSVPKLRFTATYSESSLAIMTQFRGQRSQLDKLMSVVDRSSRIGLVLMFFLTPILLKCFLRRNLITAILDTFRLFCNSSLLKIPVSSASRIFLSSLFVFLITIQGLYQGQLSSLLSIRVDLPNINTFEDLAMSGYKIYGHADFAHYFDHQIFGDRYVVIPGYNCTEYVLRDPMAACVDDREYLVYAATTANLHVSTGSIDNVYISWVMRDDWPLQRKVDHVLEVYARTRAMRHDTAIRMQNELNTLRTNEDGNKDQSFKVLTLRELDFAFTFLGIGLAFATLCFIIEIIIGR